jgi:hypothetical protein
MLIHTHGNDLYRVAGFSFRAFIAIALLFAIVNASHAQPQAFVTLDVSNLSASPRNDVYVTFGQVVAEGQAPTGSSIGARYPGGADIDLQVDEKATHSDGSLRHAVFTARLDNLAGSATDTIELYSGNTDPGGGAITVANLLATAFNVTVTLIESGTSYTVSARDLLGGSVVTWLDGPLASEWLVSGRPETSGGMPHDHLSVQFHIRAYEGMDSARVDVVVENTNAYPTASAGRNHTYNYSIVVPGKTTISDNNLEHPIFTRWHRVVWWGTDQQVEVAHDTEYLQATRAVPNYDDDITIDTGFLGDMDLSVAPLDNGDHNDDMSQGGSQDQIGPLPRWTATYLVSGDRRAMLNMLANDGNGSGAYPMHYRDGLGTPVSIDTHQDAGTDEVNGDFNVGSPSGSPYTPDTSHHPSSGYVPYLITGDYYFLEEIQFWANYGLLDRSPDARNGSEGLLQEHQVRGRAWAMRSLGQAAYITPDGPLKDYFIDKIDNNLSDWNARYNNNSNANNLGLAVPRSDEGDGEGLNVYKTWMDDYYSWAMAYLVELGFDNAAAHRDWKFQSALGRMGSTDFCWIRAAEYSRDVGEGAGSSGTFAGSWAAIQAQLAGVMAGGTSYGSHVCGSASMGDWAAAFDDDHNGEAGELLGRSASTTGYPVYLRIVLAAAADAGATNADLAWQRFIQNPVQPDFSDYPTFALSPRGDVDPVVDPGVPGSGSSSSGGSDDDDALGGDDDSGGGDMGALLLFMLTLTLMIQRQRMVFTDSDQGGSKMSGKKYAAPALLLVACAVSLPAIAGNCPADLSTLTPGHWCEVPDSRLEDVSEVDNPKVIDPWSGGVFDTDENRLIIWGGGHTDYDGNEMYAFDVDTQQWSQITDRSSPTRDAETYGDGLPSSRHTYDGIQYLPGLKWLWSSGGSVYRNGNCTNQTWIYDFNAARNEGWSRISAGSGGGRCEDSSAYDPVTGHVWFWSREGLYEFDPQNLGGPWRLRDDERESRTYTGAIDPVRRKLVFIGEGYGYMFDITNPSSITGGEMNSVGQKQVEDVKAPGIAYDPTNGGRFVAWGGRGSIATTDVFALDVESSLWTRYPAAAGNSTTPTSAAMNGTYGRFRYVPSENVFILVNAIDENVFFYKMADSGGISDGLPVINVAVSPASIAVGGTVTVTWSVSNATSCTASGDWSGSVPLNGTQSIGPLNEQRNYVARLNCTGAGGFASREAVVAVGSSGGSSSSGGPDNDPSGDEVLGGDDDDGGGAIDILFLLSLAAFLAGSSRRSHGKTN